MSETTSEKDGSRRMRPAERYFAPSDRPWLLPLLTVLPLVLLALVPLFLMARTLIGSEDAMRTDLFRHPMPSLPIERELAAKLNLVRFVPLDPRLPLWQSIPPSGLFSVNETDTPKIREALRSIRTYSDEIASGNNPTAEEVGGVRRKLAEFVDKQGKDRVAVLYSRAVLDIWMHAYNSAIDELQRSERKILTESSQQDSPQAAGALIALRYLRGYAKLLMARDAAAAPGETNDDPCKLAADADKDFVKARDGADSLADKARVGRDGPFFEMNGDVHMVAMSTAKIWLGHLLAISQCGDPKTAAKEAEPLFSEASYMNQEPLLAATLALLASGIGNSNVTKDLTSDDFATVKVGALDVSRFLLAARVVARLPIKPAESPGGGDTSALRTEFRAIYRAAYPSFPRMEFGLDRSTGDRLDAWLFFRQWHDDLVNGDLAELFDGIDALMKSRSAGLPMFATWREQAMQKLGPDLLSRAIDNTRTSEEDAQAIYRFLLAYPFPLSMRVEALARSVFGTWWWLGMVSYPLLLILIVWVWKTLSEYRRMFGPMHYAARMRDSVHGNER